MPIINPINKRIIFLLLSPSLQVYEDDPNLKNDTFYFDFRERDMDSKVIIKMEKKKTTIINPAVRSDFINKRPKNNSDSIMISKDYQISR